MAGGVALLGSLAAATSIFAVPAFPTSYATSPVAYSVDAVAHGASRFAQHCSSCHGADARGDGPAAASLPVKPANLAEHALHHLEGNLFWWISHGVAGKSMPAFSPRLADREIWEIVQFLVARASAEAATSLGPHVDGQSRIRVPDFAYDVPAQGQRMLVGDRTPALIVLDPTVSDARRAQLATNHRLMHAHLRVILVPMSDAQPSNDARRMSGTGVAGVYRMFVGEDLANRVELLVDGAGILRARWTGIPTSASDRDAEIAMAVQRLPASSSVPASSHHGHD
jgi:mono/diheme cytochrome c family protein